MSGLPILHAELGASSSDRWMSCPGSVALSRGMPDNTSVYAELGTAAHDLAERALRKGLDPDVWLDTEINGHLVDEEMCEAVQVYIDYVRQLVREHVAIGNDSVERYIEQHFNLGPLNPPEPMFGTGDFVLWNPVTRHLDVTDYKHGQGVVVDAIENRQFMYYALGAVVKLRKKPKTIRVTVVQPRAYHPAGVIRSFEFPYEKLVEFKSKLFAAAEATQDPNAPLVAGDHCRFCKAAAVCPERKRVAVEIAQTEFEVMPERTPPKPELLTTDELALVLTHADAISSWLSDVRAHVINLLDTGHEVPGFKLVDKRATRRWTDEEAAKAYLLEQLGPGAYAPAKLVSPAQAEKALKQLKLKLDNSLVEKKSSGKTLAPDADVRQARLPAAHEDFDAVSES